MQALEVDKRVDWAGSIPFFGMHAAALIGAFFVPWSWEGVLLCLGLYYVRMFGITAGFHRYFSHRSYKTSRSFQFLLAWLGTSSLQKGVLWWAAHHRYHHRHSDQPTDLHSPARDGFWYSHVGWILSGDTNETQWEHIKDLTKFPELVWLNRFHLVPPVAMAAALVLLGGWPAFYWGFVASTVLLWHGTFTINSLSHVFGWRRYESGDTSRNNPLLALITLGEGWHNNHHTYQSSANQGFFWWELDLSYMTLKALSVFGIVWDLRKPPLAALESKRCPATSGDHARHQQSPASSLAQLNPDRSRVAHQ